MKFNVIYNNNSGPRTPTGGTQNQSVAGLSGVSVWSQKVPLSRKAPVVGNRDAASVIQSNGEDIGNAQLPSNPLPPGITQ